MAETKEVEMTVRQAIAFWKAVEEMAGSGIKLSVLRSIDMALNKRAVEPIVVGWDKATADPVEARKMNEEFQQVNRKFGKDAERLAVEIDRLVDKYKSVIDETDRITREKRASFDLPQKVRLVMIPRAEFKCPDDSDKAANVFYGLLPCIE